MLKIISLVLISLMLLNGCVSQNNQSFGQNFDKSDAAKTRVSLGLTYLNNGNFSQAKFNLDKALEFAPRSADANFAMAYYYQSVGELEQAEEAYQVAMDLDPKNANIANSYGAFLCQNGQYEKAKTYFLKAVNTSSYISSAETYENLALCSQSQGKFDDSIQYLRSAVNHQPGRANSLFLLANALIETQQWQEARAILRRYEKASQISPQSLWMAMKLEQGTGNTVAAKGYADMMLKIFPTDPVTKAMLSQQQSPAETSNNALGALVTTSAKKSESSSIAMAPSANAGETQNLEEASEMQSANDTAPTESVDGQAKTLVIISERAVKQVSEPEPTAPQKPAFHIVARGENLYRISLLYNIRMQRLIDWNGLADASAIFVGKKLSLVKPSDVE